MSFADGIRHSSHGEEQADCSDADQAPHEVAAHPAKPAALSHSVNFGLAVRARLDMISDLIRSRFVAPVPDVFELGSDGAPVETLGFFMHIAVSKGVPRRSSHVVGVMGGIPP